MPLSSACVLLLLAAGSADDHKARAKEQADKAGVQFKLGRFEDALNGYTAAYQLYQASGLLLNIGQCHRHLNNHDKAIFFFNGYLRDNPKAPNAEQVRGLIEEEQQKKAAERPASAPVQIRSAAAAPPPVRAVQQKPPLTRQWWFWTAIGGGAAVVVTAVVLGVALSQGGGGSLGTLDRR